jgi:bacterioferritin (cytochrome b1)
MTAMLQPTTIDRYARCIEVSKRVRWDIDQDVIRGRDFDFSKTFIPAGLSGVNDLPFLSESDRRLYSHVQGRTYANMFGLVERFICAKILELSHDHFMGDQVALEALVRFSDEELKHQELFRRIEHMIARNMPEGYEFAPKPNDVAKVVLGKSTWAVLALTLHIELFTLAHYRESIDKQQHLDPLYKDVFLYHWKEESQHAIMDELEWIREDASLSEAERDQAVTDLIDLVAAVDGIVQAQAQADATYFQQMCEHYSESQMIRIHLGFLDAYRWQFIVSGVKEPRFVQVLSQLISADQGNRINAALAPLMA